MASYKDIKASLDYILKNGDTYDIINKATNKYPSNHPFWRVNALILSRILYAGILVGEKIKSWFADVDKVEVAEEQVREELGFDVDVLKSKFNYDRFIKTNPDTLSVCYKESDAYSSDYIGNLKKLLNFVEIYKLDVILRKDNIECFLLGKELTIGNETTWRKILPLTFSAQTHNQSEPNFLDCPLMVFTPQELSSLITFLETERIDKKFLKEMALKIDDNVIRDAITDFFRDGNRINLRDLVLARLNLYLNNDSVKKDKTHGKLFYNVVVIDDKIKIQEINTKGEVISSRVLSLYDYLEVSDLEELVLKIDDDADLKEVRVLSSLYIFLNEIENVKASIDTEQTFYQFLYKKYKENRKNNDKKRLPYVYDIKDKLFSNFVRMILGAFFTGILFLVMITPGSIWDIIQYLCYKNEESNLSDVIGNMILAPYEYAWSLEEKFIDKIFLRDDSFLSKIWGDYISFSGDGSKLDSNEVVARVRKVDAYYDIPDYFASGYATSASYNKGNIYYNIEVPMVDFDDFAFTDDLFLVKYTLDKNVIDNVIKDHCLNLYEVFYPLGDSYVITKVRIRDAQYKNRCLEINYQRAMESGGKLSLEEESLLSSIEQLEIEYVYGKMDTQNNSFVDEMHKEGEYSSLGTHAKNIIVDSLDLANDASLEEVFQAIKNKNYSITPFKDAGLSRKIKRMTEEEYLKTTANLDSLICNLAATLVVEVDPSLVYTVGYVKDTDGTIKLGSAHAWATDLEGNIVDATPYKIEDKKEAEEMIDKIMAWGIENNIPLWVILTLISFYLKEKFDKKVKFVLNIKKVDRLLSNNDINDICARIRKYYYGGINLSTKDEPYIIADKLIKDFAGLSDEELRKLADELIQEKDYRASQVVKNIPFMRENKDVILRELRKNKQEI